MGLQYARAPWPSQHPGESCEDPGYGRYADLGMPGYIVNGYAGFSGRPSRHLKLLPLYA